MHHSIVEPFPRTYKTRFIKDHLGRFYQVKRRLFMKIYLDSNYNWATLLRLMTKHIATF